MKPVLSKSFKRMKGFSYVVKIDDSTEIGIFTEIGHCKIVQTITASVYRKERIMRGRWRFAMNPLRMELVSTELVEETSIVSRTLQRLVMVLEENGSKGARWSTNEVS